MRFFLAGIIFWFSANTQAFELFDAFYGCGRGAPNFKECVLENNQKFNDKLSISYRILTGYGLKAGFDEEELQSKLGKSYDRWLSYVQDECDSDSWEKLSQCFARQASARIRIIAEEVKDLDSSVTLASFMLAIDQLYEKEQKSTTE